MKSLLLCLLAVLSYHAGYCQSKRKIQKEMNSWMGATKQQLLMSYGLPSRTGSDGAGGEIVVFSRQVVRDNPSLVDNGRGLEVQQGIPFVFYKHRMFYINAEDKVYHWNYESSQVPPDRLYMQVNGSVDVNHR